MPVSCGRRPSVSFEPPKAGTSCRPVGCDPHRQRSHRRCSRPGPSAASVELACRSRHRLLDVQAFAAGGTRRGIWGGNTRPQRAPARTSKLSTAIQHGTAGPKRSGPQRDHRRTLRPHEPLAVRRATTIGPLQCRDRTHDFEDVRPSLGRQDEHDFDRVANVGRTERKLPTRRASHRKGCLCSLRAFQGSSSTRLSSTTDTFSCTSAGDEDTRCRPISWTPRRRLIRKTLSHDLTRTIRRTRDRDVRGRSRARRRAQCHSEHGRHICRTSLIPSVLSAGRRGIRHLRTIVGRAIRYGGQGTPRHRNFPNRDARRIGGA